MRKNPKSQKKKITETETQKGLDSCHGVQIIKAKSWRREFHDELTGTFTDTKSKLIIVLLSYVLRKLLLLLLPLSPFLSTFFLLVGIRWKPKGTYCLIMHVKAEGNPRVKCNLRFICGIYVPCFLRYHPSIGMIQCSINSTISYCLGHDALSLCNRICRVQPQLLGYISQWNTRIRDTDVAKSSPYNIVPQSNN